MLCGLLGSVVQRLQGHSREASASLGGLGDKIGTVPRGCLLHASFKRIGFVNPQRNEGGGMAGNRAPARGHPHPTGHEPVLACPLSQGLVARGSLGFPGEGLAPAPHVQKQR